MSEMKFSIKDLYLTNSALEIFNGKFHFLCSTHCHFEKNKILNREKYAKKFLAFFLVFLFHLK